MSALKDFFRGMGYKGRLKKAQKLIFLGKEQEAISLLEEWLGRDPSLGEAYIWVAIAKNNLKDYEGALGSIDKALKIGARNYFCKIVKGEALLHLGRYNESLKLLTEALEHSPDNTRVSYLIGLNYIRLGNTEKAVGFFETAIKYDRELVDSRLLAMAETYLHKIGDGGTEGQ